MSRWPWRRTDGADSPEGTSSVDVLDPSAEPDPAGPADEGLEGVRAPRPNRTIWVVAAVAVVSLGAGLALSRFVISPAQAAADAEPPEAGLITVPVEQRELSSDVTIRGDALYDDPVDVRLETGELGGPAVVTGQVPEVGAEIGAGGILLEVTGRPVIVLPGELPVYRSLRVGTSGPDVLQLKAALVALGIDPGNADSDVFDGATASAVDALYARAGYPSPEPEEGARENVRAAEESLRSAQDALAQAQADLDRAASGPSDAVRVEQDNLVRAAERQLADARAGVGELSVAEAEDALRLAQVQRDEALAPADTSAEAAGRDAAARGVEDARTALADAAEATLTHLPASEVVYVGTLPRRVDSVAVQRGSTVEGSVLTISGASLEIVASASVADAELLAVDMPAVLTLGDTEVAAHITNIGRPSAGSEGDGEGDGEGEGEGDDGGGGGDGARVDVTLVPDELTEEQRAQLVGTNVRVRVPVSSTGGEVLAVPVAALTAGPGGESRVEVDRGDGETELVVVETGLSAEGFVEITSSEEPLEAGDLVVVGE
ncbi:hypothetical protein Bcav_2962 [Beutenbergia cavernae DSM 12333]|uniref:Peptidoglycan-binding domain 1 protein n=1 Tax=Beutenbergia cavernae (strain ATCC BAA-8 / DSM 12333 / CCUG 43141 / JCM 11478 / NBRC 16432 / NCIMB 13614 / HKI 0122) TaxID=471853 RepID=C5BZ92_BEUC1|nr:hypothetical protein [Beutenbergia cavernae]ACQ81207.1 hypothetical protein Bcav_2962 [Beutenbergia cavernae DSM 12333]